MPKITVHMFSAADDDEIYIVEDTPAVRRAIDLRCQVCEAFGDGTTDIYEGEVPDDFGIAGVVEPNIFICRVLEMLDDSGEHYEEQLTWIYEAGT